MLHLLENNKSMSTCQISSLKINLILNDFLQKRPEEVLVFMTILENAFSGLLTRQKGFHL